MASLEHLEAGLEEINGRIGRLLDVLIDEHEIITPDQARFIWTGPEEDSSEEEQVSKGKGKTGGK